MGMAMEIREDFGVKTAFRRKRLPAKQAWARYVRNRWPENCVGHVAAEWDLTPAQARGVVYAQISPATVEIIDAHKRGGDAVLLTVRAIQFETDLLTYLRAFITEHQERRARDRQAIEAEEAALGAVAAHLRLVPGVGAGGHGRHGPRAALADGDVGAEGRSLGGRPVRAGNHQTEPGE